jgi:hypothetical protein
MKLVRLIKMCLNETYSRVRIGLKQGNALSPLFFNFALVSAIRKVQENQVRLKLNWMHQLLAYIHDMHLQGNNIYKKKTQKL